MLFFQKISFVAFIGCMALVMGAFTHPAYSAEQSVAKNGSIAKIEFYSETEPKGYFQNKRILMIQHKRNFWRAYIGIPLDYEASEATVLLKNVNRKTVEKKLTVESKDYPEERIYFKDDRKVTPPKKDYERIARESVLLREAFSKYREVPLELLSLEKPVAGKMGSAFGLRRILNDIPKSPHKGVDFKAPVGTPVYAALDGVVTLIGDFFYTGKTVVVDHGQGCQTVYCHLKSVDVQTEQTLKKGGRLGQVGMTGRATGPHLHFGLNLNGVRVDPSNLWESTN